MLRECDRARPEGSRRRGRYSGASYAPVSLVSGEHSNLFEVAGFQVAKVTFLNRHASGNPPGKFRLVYEPDVDVKEALLKFVLDPLDDFASRSGILATRNELTRCEVG